MRRIAGMLYHGLAHSVGAQQALLRQGLQGGSEQFGDFGLHDCIRRGDKAAKDTKKAGLPSKAKAPVDDWPHHSPAPGPAYPAQ
jgi:hypothetical protein